MCWRTLSCFVVSTVRDDGRSHRDPLVAVWLDDALHFCTGAAHRRSDRSFLRDLERVRPIERAVSAQARLPSGGVIIERPARCRRRATSHDTKRGLSDLVVITGWVGHVEHRPIEVRWRLQLRLGIEHRGGGHQRRYWRLRNPRLRCRSRSRRRRFDLAPVSERPGDVNGPNRRSP